MYTEQKKTRMGSLASVQPRNSFFIPRSSSMILDRVMPFVALLHMRLRQVLGAHYNHREVLTGRHRYRVS